MPEHDARSDDSILATLGGRVARERLRRNQTQEALSEEAGVSVATLRRLEAGRSTQVVNLIRVLRALGLLGRLDALFPEPPVRPLDELEREGRSRQRASSPRRTSEPDRSSGWTWGEDR